MKPPFDLKTIKPGEFSYLTRRKLEAKGGAEGEIFLWKRKEEEESHYLLACPHCGKEQEGAILLNKRPYRVRCAACQRSITLPKLLGKAKKDRG
jgi:ribosomal protein S27E